MIKKMSFALVFTLGLWSTCSKYSSIVDTSTITTTTTTSTTSSKRYIESVFSSVTTVSNIVYGSNTSYAGTTKSLTMDIYYPASDTVTSRPLLILVPGGGFSSMTDKSSFADEATAIAKYGYVVASINYRTFDATGTMTNSILKQIILQGMQDAKAAIRFFRKDAAASNIYKINAQKIFLGGHSAGAIVASHAVYLDNLSKADAAFQTIINNNGGLEGTSGNSGYSSTVSGNINLSGALIDKTYITSDSKPYLGLYGTADNLVPYDDGTFSLGNISSISMSGANAMYSRAKSVGISSTVYPISGGDHFSTAKSTCTDCLSQIASFMSNQF